MIALWLLYVVVVGILVALGAVAVEWLLRLWRRPVRFVWAAALLVTVAAPLVVLLAGAGPAPAPAAPATGVRTGEAVALPTMTVVPSLADRIAASLAGLDARLEPAARRLAPLDAPLVALWALLSATLLVALARSAHRLRRRRGEWTPTVVDGVPVLVAPDLGPAVVGGRDARVVLPSWAMQLDAPLRQLVLRHEHEHLRAGDPHLLLAGLVAVIAMPWNPALWWQLGRLRLAVEMDCDRRVLRAHGDVERYGLLLMAVSQRAGGLMRLAMPALSESSGALERRIAAMTAATPRRRAVRVVASVTVALAAIAIACLVPNPGRLSAATPTGARLAASADTIDVGDTTHTYFEFQVEEPVQVVSGAGPVYPAALRAQGVTGQVIAQFVVDVDGSVVPGTFKVIESSHELFAQAVEAAVLEMRFRPAVTDGHRVRQLVQQ
ncbi:MAG TPA: M56 family metallopeptidase, partial [Gemmatimonadaceae bacterium]